MRKTLPHPAIMLITDITQAVLPLEDIIAGALAGGCKWVVLRDLNASDSQLLKQAIPVKYLCTKHKAKLFIGRNAKIAKAIEADGLHLSSSQIVDEARSICGDMIIGKSCHTVDDVKRAQKSDLDYITLSPIFETTSKPGYGPALGLETLVQQCKETSLPVVALGGIDVGNAAACIKAGAQGVAVMGSIMRSKTPQQSMEALLGTVPK